MTMHRRRLELLILPHVKIFGGAGIYIRNAIDVLCAHADVTVIGRAGSEYSGENRTTLYNSMPARPVLPAYEGASFASFVFNAFLSPFRAWTFFRWLRRNKEGLASHDALIVTSSIDLLTLAIVKFVIPDLKSVCLIQENALLTGLRGAINRALLKRAEIRVSISQSWSDRAEKYNIQSFLAVNPFDLRNFDPSPDADAEYDLLYMGGGGRNKGFNLFLSLIDHLAAKGIVRAALLGQLSPSQTDRVTALSKTLEARGSSLESPGFVADTAAYLDRSRLLLLPITNPHFCRPAVEAGFCERTFVISDLEQLEDFATKNINCVMAQPDDVADWSAACQQLLADDALRHRLARSNRDLSTSRFSPAAFDESFRRVLAAC